MMIGARRQYYLNPKVLRAIFLGAVLLLLFVLAACGKSSAESPSTSAPATDATTQASAASNASITLQPDRGYGGLYIQVSGANWPQNMMVLVTLEDAQGRSETLAASDTDPNGNLNTGFLFPIDQRWLGSDALAIVTTSADGKMESKAPFTLVAPGEAVTGDSPLTTTAVAVAESGGTTATVTGTVSNPVTKTATTKGATKKPQFDNTVILPLIASAGMEKGSPGRASSGPTAGVTQVDVEIDPSGSKTIDCNNGGQWVRVAILSNDGFDATAVDPGSVSVASSGELGYGGPGYDNGAPTFIAFDLRSNDKDAARNRSAYQWRWELDDADGDGTMDMVMEFRLDYIHLDCNAAVVAVSGHTRDGKQFEGTHRLDMLVLERG
jgi:hypothetical protein